jgi:hypothetical protein
MSCNIVIEDASSPSNSFTNRTKDFKIFCIIHSGIQPGSPRVNTGVGGSGVSGALFLKSSILAGDFTKIFVPLATNLSLCG